MARYVYAGLSRPSETKAIARASQHLRRRYGDMAKRIAIRQHVEASRYGDERRSIFWIEVGVAIVTSAHA
jgi:hypothetical protein